MTRSSGPFVVVVRGTWQEACRARGITYGRLADLTGVSPASVYAYAAGRRRTPDAWLDRVRDVVEERWGE